MTKERKTYLPITSENICHAYALLHKNGLVSFPLTEDNKRKVAAIVANINSPHFGVEVYSTIEEKAVAFLYFLIKDHPFTDGNKRTACLVFEVVCDVNNIAPRFDKFSLDALAVFIETIRDTDHHEVIRSIVQILFHGAAI